MTSAGTHAGDRPLRVAVLGGGPSLEHDVSIASAREVCRHLDPARYACRPVRIDRDGVWRVAPRDDARFDLAAEGVARRPGAAIDALLDEAHIDVVFPALHGAFGEDGRVQALLDLYGIRYVGAGVAASAVAMDKLRTRECLTAHGLPMGRALTFPARVDAVTVAERVATALGFPCFLKIDVSGSSFGVQRADSAADVASFVAEHASARLVAEAALRGEEISVPVLEDLASGQPQPLPPVGIYPIAEEGYFSVRAKYEAGRCDEVVPPRGLDAEMLRTVGELAVRAHVALACRHVSRTDMIVTADGPRILEVNTLPGMTSASLLPKCAAAAGLSFPALLDRLVQLALAER
ncbi:MAG: D-alanine--D-alanine ligase A [Planctomycetes bacterium]|nr:D-alanine--D-alanine ligase A [Planctomycetota bacterium]